MVSNARSTSRTALAAIVAALATSGCPLVAAAQSFAPARLIHLPLEYVSCPSSERSSPMLVCQAVVTRAGSVFNRGGAHCFGDIEEDRARVELITSRVMLAKFEPARVDGRRTKVYASFRLSFREESGVCNVTYLPNLGTQQDEFGPEYFAPQEIVTRGSWADRARPTWRRGRGVGVAFSMSVAVDELGSATDGRAESNNFAPDESVVAAVRALEESRFVPALVGGIPRPARYFELFYVHPGCRSVPPTRAERDRC